MLYAVLNKSWKQHLKKQQLYTHLLLISQTSLVRQIRHAVHCWRSKDKLISNFIIWMHQCWPTSSVQTLDAVKKTSQKQLITEAGSKGEPRKSVMLVWDDDDDDICARKKGLKYFDIYPITIVKFAYTFHSLNISAIIG